MGTNDGSIAITKKKTKELLNNKKFHSPGQLKRRLSTLTRILEQLEDYVPWPALQESFRADIREMQSLLDRVKSDA